MTWHAIGIPSRTEAENVACGKFSWPFKTMVATLLTHHRHLPSCLGDSRRLEGHLQLSNQVLQPVALQEAAAPECQALHGILA